jgi:protein-L-isoaspartate(D-aspartate) O-methyltransferase
MPLERVYRIDEAIPTHLDGQGVPHISSAPVMMAVMLDLEPGQHVLEIGAGTDYNAARMGQLVGQQGSVISTDINPAVIAEADALICAPFTVNPTPLLLAR